MNTHQKWLGGAVVDVEFPNFLKVVAKCEENSAKNDKVLPYLYSFGGKTLAVKFVVLQRS